MAMRPLIDIRKITEMQRLESTKARSSLPTQRLSDLSYRRPVELAQLPLSLQGCSLWGCPVLDTYTLGKNDGNEDMHTEQSGNMKF